VIGRSPTRAYLLCRTKELRDADLQEKPGTERPYTNERDEGGLRYRMNSASLRLSTATNWRARGEYGKLFAKQEA
jgi:hypothetical protein